MDIQHPFEFVSRLLSIEGILTEEPAVKEVRRYPTTEEIREFDKSSLKVKIKGAILLLLQFLKPCLYLSSVLCLLSVFVYPVYWHVTVPAGLCLLAWLLSTLPEDPTTQIMFGISTAEVKEGVYAHPDASSIGNKIAKSSPFLNGTRKYNPTVWLPNGDLRTVFPFVAFPHFRVDFCRLWGIVENQEEYVAIDIAFPKIADAPNAEQLKERIRSNTLYAHPCVMKGAVNPTVDLSTLYHDSSKDLFFILHGLNGGSDEKYVSNLIKRAHALGHTVIVMIGRSMMGTQFHKIPFSGAKISDAHTVITYVHAGLGNHLSSEFTALATKNLHAYTPTPSTDASTTSISASVYDSISKFARMPLDIVFKDGGVEGVLDVHKKQWKTGIMLVGYSMGSILSLNYVSRTGAQAGILGSISFSGGLETFLNSSLQKWQKFWHAIVVSGLKDTWLRPRMYLFDEKLGKRRVDIVECGKAELISEMDTYFTAPYHGYTELLDYYHSQSSGHEDRYKNIQVPTVLVVAQDDPIVIFNTMRRTKEMTSTNPNLVVSVTTQGGHLGWPEGMCPWKHGFKYMSEHVLSVYDSIKQAQK